MFWVQMPNDQHHAQTELECGFWTHVWIYVVKADSHVDVIFLDSICEHKRKTIKWKLEVGEWSKSKFTTTTKNTGKKSLTSDFEHFPCLIFPSHIIHLSTNTMDRHRKEHIHSLHKKTILGSNSWNISRSFSVICWHQCKRWYCCFEYRAFTCF